MTLIDYPGKVAATVFTVGCNFRCPFCHNPELVLSGSAWQHGSISEKEFFKFLETRKNKLDGICLTGGEPTIQPDIEKFIVRIKKMGFLVKLDSNGTRPDVLKKLYDKKLLDFVAMDIKNSLDKYESTCGSKADIKRISLSVEIIKNSRIPYEFRTTVVPGLHLLKDFKKIGEWLKGSDHYVLQKFRDGKIIDENLRKKIKNAKIDLCKAKKILEKYIKTVDTR